MDIAVRLFNFVIEKPYIDDNAQNFAVYNPELFFSKFPQSKTMLECKIKGIQYTILVLKNINLPKDDTVEFIKNKADEFLNFASVLVYDTNYAKKIKLFITETAIENEFRYSELSGNTGGFRRERTATAPILFKNGFNNSLILSVFTYSTTELTELEDKIRNAINWLGKAIRTSNLTDSFLNACIAMECLLSEKKSQGNITNTLAESLAFLVGKNKNERISIYADVKDKYNLRSKLVHSGKTDITEDDYYKLSEYLVIGIEKLLDLIKTENLKNMVDFRNYINELKFKD
ncbi:hypothetical protein FACS18945_2450 [Bacteroidia bacterium]|nr:hypothetical protein FACS18945_2450 [Bacteroidia bacterium]